MTVRVGINGFGRIGRGFLRAALTNKADIEVVAVNDLTDAKTLATLLEWDTLTGHLEGVRLDGNDIYYAADKKFTVLAEPDPTKIKWGDYGVDIVIESTGRFVSGELAKQHLQGGARKVIISAPAKGGTDGVQSIVLGVNDQDLDPDHFDVFSNGSCTTNSLAPVAKVLNDNWGIENGFMTTVHAYTGDQKLHDAPHRDLRRARMAAENIIPTSSGAAIAIGLVIPELAGKLTGAALRVPIPVGSITDLTVQLKKPATPEEINAKFAEVADKGNWEGILEYSEAPLVSTDIRMNPHSSIFDAPLTKSIGSLVQVKAWYDNEWGFSNRMVEFAERIAK
ncbi:MAG: type I glyceraldehyde-3-phosphate dehydrogenase [Actinomycetaceae bacterium]|nr:type I glyceraldehyde-3-phosphate dehydrogenase [Actinomycetaceae bacterium]MDY6083424.1 type I glyceraldehyde-3-phosphate dehydrogenase [Actinomycetaceae bacterium]